MSYQRWRAEDLRNRETLAIGQACDLKHESETIRVWLSRCGVEDGEPYPDKVTVEGLVNGRWEILETYPG